MARNSNLIEKVANERIERLFVLAEGRWAAGDDGLARKYIKLARKIGSHYKVGVPLRMKNRICKKCNAVLLPGINCRVRVVRGGYLAYKCSCGAEKKVFFRDSLQS